MASRGDGRFRRNRVHVKCLSEQAFEMFKTFPPNKNNGNPSTTEEAFRQTFANLQSSPIVIALTNKRQTNKTSVKTIVRRVVEQKINICYSIVAQMPIESMDRSLLLDENVLGVDRIVKDFIHWRCW